MPRILAVQSPAIIRLCALPAAAALFVFLGMSAAICRARTIEAGFTIVRSFSSADVGTHVIGLSAVQDSDGTLYFGSNTLLSHDGDRWRSFEIDGAYGLYGLDIAPDGRMWAAAAGEIGWFSRVNDTWQYRSLRDKLPPQERNLPAGLNAFSFRGGAVFTMEDRLLHWDGATLKSWSMPGSRRVRTFKVGDDVLIQHAPIGLYQMETKGPKLLVSADILGDRTIYFVERIGPALLLVTSRGLFRFSDQTLIPIDNGAASYLAKNRPTSVVALRDGRFAVGTMEDGVAFITRTGAIDRVLNASTGFQSAYSLPLLVDHDGALWVGSRSSIFRVAVNSPSSLFDSRLGIPVQPTVGIARYADRLIVGSSQGLFSFDAAQQRFVTAGVTGAGLNAIVADDRGILAAGYRAVTRIADGSVTVEHSTDRDVTAIALSRRHPGTIFIGDGRTILGMAGDGQPRVIAQGLPEPANSIAEDEGGNVWIGTWGHGLFVAKSTAPAGSISHLVDNDLGIANRRQAQVFASRDGTLLAFNAAGGWVRDASTGRFSRISDSPARTAAAFGHDAVGSNVWLIHPMQPNAPATVARVSLGVSGAVWQAHFVDELPSIGVPRSIFAEANGPSTTLWIGGTTGVLRHEFDGTPSVPVPHAPLVRAMARAEQGTLHQVTSTPLAYSTRGIDFDFAIPEFGRRSALRLETRIDGIDDAWVALGTNSRRELNSLRAGRYTVRARAVAESGVTSPETTFTFEVLQPWWRTAPSLVGLGLVVMLGASGIYRLRVRTLRRRNFELEQKVRERTDQLERASAAKTEFVANMSHDIRNPLNGIVGLALALEDTKLDSRQREIVATLRECTTYLSSLVDDVLDFASIEAGKVELRPGRYAAAELLQSIVTTLKADTAERGASLSVDVATNIPPHLVGDAGRIQQILVNYVSNALKYAGGHIRLSVTLPATSPGEVEFAVADEGPGINSSEQSTLFSKFTRLDGAKRDGIPGTGLGLAACRLLADIMGGSVGVSSEAGQGARFYLRLPLAIATEPADLPAASLPNTTVLLVEDTDYNAWAATAVLSKLGLACDRARTGEEAVRLFGEKRFNVVLLDRNLPDMDGTEVARRIRQLEADGADGFRSVLLAVTAYCTAEDKQVCLDAGMDAFLGKPLTPEKLRRVLIDVGRRMLAAASVHVSTDVPTRPTKAGAELNMSMLSYLADDTTDGLAVQVEKFLQTLNDTEGQLAQAWSRRDFQQLADSAHFVLSQGRLIGGTTLIDAALKLEYAAKAGDASACGELLGRVGHELRAVKEALRRRRSVAQPV